MDLKNNSIQCSLNKKGLHKTMLNRAYRLSSNWKHFINECEALNLTFSNLLYPSQLIETTVNQFITNVATDNGRVRGVE